MSLRGFINEASVGSLDGDNSKGGLVHYDSVSNQGDLEDGGHSQDRGQEEEWVGSSSDQRWGLLNPKLWKVLS